MSLAKSVAFTVEIYSASEVTNLSDRVKVIPAALISGPTYAWPTYAWPKYAWPTYAWLVVVFLFFLFSLFFVLVAR